MCRTRARVYQIQWSVWDARSVCGGDRQPHRIAARKADGSRQTQAMDFNPMPYDLIEHRHRFAAWAGCGDLAARLPDGRPAQTVPPRPAAAASFLPALWHSLRGATQAAAHCVGRNAPATVPSAAAPPEGSHSPKAHYPRWKYHATKQSHLRPAAGKSRRCGTGNTNRTIAKKVLRVRWPDRAAPARGG